MVVQLRGGNLLVAMDRAAAESHAVVSPQSIRSISGLVVCAQLMCQTSDSCCIRALSALPLVEC